MFPSVHPGIPTHVYSGIGKKEGPPWSGHRCKSIQNKLNNKTIRGNTDHSPTISFLLSRGDSASRPLLGEGGGPLSDLREWALLPDHGCIIVWKFEIFSDIFSVKYKHLRKPRIIRRGKGGAKMISLCNNQQHCHRKMSKSE